MGIIRLRSTNPKFGFVIFKNPSTGLLVKENKVGHMFGYYPLVKSEEGAVNESEYVVYFRDGFNRVSYQTTPDSSFDYINVLQYASPRILLDTNRQFFRSTLNKAQPDDEDSVYENSVVSEFCKIDFNVKRLHHFPLYFTDVQFDFHHLKGQVYRVSLTTTRSLHYLLNLADILFMYITLMNSDYYERHESQTEALIKSMNIIGADYYIRYLVKNRMITSPTVFEKFKPLLEQSQGTESVQMCYGNTQTQRLQHLQGLLSFSRCIVDIGCGEGSYAVPYSRKLKKVDKTYYAMDVDADPLATLNRKVKDKGLENVKTFGSLEELLKGYGGEECDLIITEVVEHMDREPGQQLLREILNKFNWKSAIITTPNREFNQYYIGLEGFRHNDHKWEATRVEFREYMEKVLINVAPTIKDESHSHHLSTEYLDIGDRVNRIPITQGCLIVRN